MARAHQETAIPGLKTDKSFCGIKLLVCGKGGSGKSSVVVLMAQVLRRNGLSVLVIDGDASNPGGVARLLFGRTGPRPLIEFFGGREKVTCPVDDPSPLTRKGDVRPVGEEKVDLAEIAPEYLLREDGIILFQVGKIEAAYEGCDGPMSKVTRDFSLKGDHVTLIDVEAGIEHFGRGVEKHVDIVLVVVDPTFESFWIAEKVVRLCRDIGIGKVWAILNKVESQAVESVMRQELEARRVRIIGNIRQDPEVLKAGLRGIPLGDGAALEDVRGIVGTLQNLL